jgi:NAD+ synthase
MLPKMNPEQVANEIQSFIIDRIISAGHSGAIVGLSGGVDSTVVAALAARAIQNWNTPDQKNPLFIVGYSLPSKVNNPDDIQEVRALAKTMDIPIVEHSLDSLVSLFTSELPPLQDFDRGNLISRIRAVYLNTEASRRHALLLGTGNKDEDYGIGYYTLFGDGAVHCSPIGGLSKRLVREMAVYLGFPEAAAKIPSAGLEVGQTDEGDLGYGYDAVEIVLKARELGFSMNEILDFEQIQDVLAPYRGKKFQTDRGIVEDILNRHHYSAIPKSMIVHPPMPKITLDYP